MNADQIHSDSKHIKGVYARCYFRFFCVCELLLRVSSKEARY